LQTCLDIRAVPRKVILQSSGFFWEVVGLEWDSLSLVITIEGLLGRKSSSSGLESREYGCRNPSRWPHVTLYLQKLALMSSTRSGRLVSIVCSRTQAMEIFLMVFWIVTLCSHVGGYWHLWEHSATICSIKNNLENYWTKTSKLMQL
jgi:hypothetical protein